MIRPKAPAEAPLSALAEAPLSALAGVMGAAGAEVALAKVEIRTIVVNDMDTREQMARAAKASLDEKFRATKARSQALTEGASLPSDNVRGKAMHRAADWFVNFALIIGASAIILVISSGSRYSHEHMLPVKTYMPYIHSQDITMAALRAMPALPSPSFNTTRAATGIYSGYAPPRRVWVRAGRRGGRR